MRYTAFQWEALHSAGCILGCVCCLLELQCHRHHIPPLPLLSPPLVTLAFWKCPCRDCCTGDLLVWVGCGQEAHSSVTNEISSSGLVSAWTFYQYFFLTSFSFLLPSLGEANGYRALQKNTPIPRLWDEPPIWVFSRSLWATPHARAMRVSGFGSDLHCEDLMEFL